jgi:tRNA 2-thiouridine synthesizing protein A
VETVSRALAAPHPTPAVARHGGLFATDSDWPASWRVLTRNNAAAGHYGSRERDPMSWLRRDQRADGQQADGPGAPSAPGGPDGPGAPAAAPVATAAPVSQPLLTIDALGRKCPIPIIMLAEQIRDVPVGAVIAVLADDPAAYTDIPAWCGMKSHEFVFRSELDCGWAFGIRRRY